MLAGCTPWPEDFARRYRDKGYWRDVTLAEMLDERIARHGGREALVCGEQRLTYAELGRRADRLAGQLAASGLRPGDRVVMQLHNVPEFLYCFFALARIGVIPVMTLPSHRHTEIGHFIEAAGAVGYFIPPVLRGFDFRDMAAEMRGRFPGLKVYVAGPPGPGQHGLADMLAMDATGIDLAALRPDPGEVALMLLSGGTTAVSKLIPRTHNDYLYNFSQAGRVCGFGEDTVFLAILPMGHNYTLGSPGVLGALAHGGKVVIAPSVEDQVVFGLIAGERVTDVATAVPLANQWINSAVPDHYDLSSLKVVQCGGSRLAPELRQRLRERLDCVHQEIYGNAEGLLNMVRLDDPLELQLTSSGAPMCDDDEIKILDDQDHELPDGATGELVVRGPYTIRGYFNNPQADARAFTADGFYRTGDIVRRQGRHLSTEGRKKDLVNRGGEKISCEEVENFILAHPKVKNVVVVAMKDAVYGERACAFLIPQPGQTVTFDEVKEFLLAQRIAKFKIPERLEVVEAFPVSPVGKIMRRELREIIDAKVNAERA